MDLDVLDKLSNQLIAEVNQDVNELLDSERQLLEPIVNDFAISKTSKKKEIKTTQSEFYLVDQKILLDGYFRNIKHILNIEFPQDLQYLIGLYISKLLVYSIGKAMIQSTTTYKPISEINELIPVIKNIFINTENFIITYGDDTLVFGNNEHFNLHLKDADAFVITLTPLNPYLREAKITDIPTIFSHGICNHYWNFFYCNNNTLYASGNNEEGCCGNGENKSTSIVLEKIDTTFLKANDCIIDMVCGAAHTLFITKYNNLYGCGWNGFGCCGKDKTINNILKPTWIMNNIIKAACGETHSLVITNKNEFIVFGGNVAAQLGIGKVTEDNQHIDAPLIHPWFKDKNVKIVDVACGFHHSLCVDINGNMYAFGLNNYGCIKGTDYSKIYEVTAEDEEFESHVMIVEPYLIEIDNKVIDMSCGEHHNMILDVNNDIFVWGRNDRNQISARDAEVIEKILKISKVDDLGMNEKTFIEQIICTHSSSIVVINPSKYC
eukprot:65746_1